MKGLTEDSIDRAISCFQDAISTRQVLPSDFDPGHAQKACDRILDLTAHGSISMEDIRKVPRFWVNLEGLAHNSNLNALESSITRVFCMRGALILHHWLLEVIPAAIKRSSRNSWIDKLVYDVGTAMDLNKSADFDSETYLPNLQHPRTFSFVPKKFRFDKKDILTSTVSAIVRLWLQFPADELSLVQLSIIDIILSKSPPSIMFLDQVWETYKTPCSTIFKKVDMLRSKSKIEAELKAFDKQYASHPFATPGSSEHQKLKFLDQLTHDWIEGRQANDSERDMVSQFTDTVKTFQTFFFIEHAKLDQYKRAAVSEY
jgi:hypothetical protein